MIKTIKVIVNDRCIQCRHAFKDVSEGYRTRNNHWTSIRPSLELNSTIRANKPIRRLYMPVSLLPVFGIGSRSSLFYLHTLSGRYPACTARSRPLLLENNNNNGNIASPNYPRLYYNNADCQWKLTARANEVSVTNATVIA